MSSASPTSRPQDDRPLFIVAAILFVALVFVGFARTYYLRTWFAVPPLRSSLVHAHGLLMSAWVALFAAQVWLVRSRRIAMHRLLGSIGAVLAIPLVVVSFLSAVTAARDGVFPPDIPPLRFLAIPLFDLLLFAGLLIGALLLRRRPAAHKRLMLLAALALLAPALARFPVPAIAALGPALFFGVPALLTLAAVGYDTARNRRLNRAFAIGALLLIASFPLRIAVLGTDAWLRFAQWLVERCAM